ncbi:MAG: F0F1 ATP synthase subunit B [Mycobacterium sp.]|nr:F0F1 ATP synthase subunit B [Mycobacterium sp.]
MRFSDTGDLSVTVLAAEEGGGTQNFLIPNGTFFFVLAIFLIVLGVIGKFVVPPIQKVLGERERMAAQIAEDNRRAATQEAAAESDYNKELATARSEAAGIRDAARSEGRQVVDDMRARANDEVAGTLQEANAELKLQSDSIAPTLNASVETLSATLASRVLGVEVPGSGGSASSTSSYTHTVSEG